MGALLLTIAALLAVPAVYLIFRDAFEARR